ncbi:hypothetical protein V8C34DRAFT_21167 [Trichoderma compactum]
MAFLFGRSYPNLSQFFFLRLLLVFSVVSFFSCSVCIDVKWVGMLSSCSIPCLFSRFLFPVCSSHFILYLIV